MIMVVAVVQAVRQIQVPLLALLLLGGCATEVWQVGGARNGDKAAGRRTGSFPLPLSGPVAAVVVTAEFALGVGLVVTATSWGAGVPATVVRFCVAVLLLTALGALTESRDRRAGTDLGSYRGTGPASVGARTFVRSGVLAAAAVAAIGAPALTRPPSGGAVGFGVAVAVAELAALAALSPRFAETLLRLGYAEPGELRRVPVTRTLRALRRSAAWRDCADVVTSPTPADVWREGCWRFVVYPGWRSGRPVDVVFAVYLNPRRPATRVAVVATADDEGAGPDRAGGPAPAGGSHAAAGDHRAPVHGDATVPAQPTRAGVRPGFGAGSGPPALPADVG